MLVKEFMIPAAQVVTLTPTDTIESALDKFLEKRISAVVIVLGSEPAGIVTKTDIAKAYKQGCALNTTVESIMVKELHTINKNVPHDKAADVFMEHKVHHAIVVDNDGIFVGLVSAWDVAREGNLDAKAWPWNRNALG